MLLERIIGLFAARVEVLPFDDVHGAELLAPRVAHAVCAAVGAFAELGNAHVESEAVVTRLGRHVEAQRRHVCVPVLPVLDVMSRDSDVGRG